MFKRIGLNDPCPCGSNRKFSKCCLPKAQRQIGPKATPQQPERNLDFVRSVVLNDHRARPVWNTVHLRPISETFHEFLVEFVKWTFGKIWWKHQLAMSKGTEHSILRWTRAYATLISSPPPPELQDDRSEDFVAISTGAVRALLALGYDLYCLQATNPVPPMFLERLRDSMRFQSARYEIAIGAIMARAGFEIVYLDEKPSQVKRCEFIATDRRTGLRVCVEAKSRVRDGVLHRPGEFAYVEDRAGLLKLIRKASKQAVYDLPLVIFIDVNLPPTPTIPPDQKAWVRDANAAADYIDNRVARSDGGKASHSLLMLTNFGFHFGENAEVEAPVEIGAIPPAAPRFTLPSPIVSAIFDSTRCYGQVPRDV